MRAIDTSPQECVRKVMELAAFKDLHHLKLTDIGFNECETLLIPARIQEVAT